MRVVKCTVCGYEKLESAYLNRECKYCGGLMMIIAEEEQKLEGKQEEEK